MKCPLLQPRKRIDQGGTTHETGDCLKADCAWWLDDVSLCAIKDIALEHRYTEQRLADVHDILPAGEGA